VRIHIRSRCIRAHQRHIVKWSHQKAIIKQPQFIATEGVPGVEVVDRNNEPEVKWVSVVEDESAI